MNTKATHPIPVINATAIKILRVEIDAALVSIGEKYGVTIKCGNGSYDGMNSGSLKVGISLKGENGEDVGREGHEFTTYAKMMGMEPGWLGQEFDHGGTPLTIIGYKPKATKNNVIVKSRQGARYVVPHTAVIRAMTTLKK